MRRETITGKAEYVGRGASLDFGDDLNLGPGDTLLGVELCGFEAYATVERAGLLRRWRTIVWARLRGVRGPRLVSK